MPLRMAIIAGEHSGDLLGAELILALRKRIPDLEVYGVTGPAMTAAGCRSIGSIETLAVVGLIEPLLRLPSLITFRRALQKNLLTERPDIVIGIDAPDFNLGLEIALKQAEIRVVHTVSPSVWAWRSYRIHRIKRAVDAMLVLFPFEEEIYRKHQIPVCFVGHPLADKIPLVPDPKSAKQQLGLSSVDPVLALLPGSRRMELENLARDFIQTAERCLRQEPRLQIITAMVNDARRSQFEEILRKTAPLLPMLIVEGQSHRVIEASDVVLVASGTATLEVMLFKKPMVVAYRLSRLTCWLLKRLVHLRWVALPNLLAGEDLVPEYLQDDVNPKLLSTAVLKALREESEKARLQKRFETLHQQLKQGASDRAVDAILRILSLPR